LWDAAVATGSVAIPAKLPAPVVGTDAQAGPNGVSPIIAELADGWTAAEGAVVGAFEGAVVAPVLEHAPTNVAARMRPAMAPVRLRWFTSFSLLVGLGPL